MSRDVYKDAAEMRNNLFWKFVIAPIVVLFWIARMVAEIWRAVAK